MAISENAANLKAGLSNNILAAEAFLRLFDFIFSNAGAAFGWVELEGVDLPFTPSALRGRVRGIRKDLRERINGEAKSSDWIFLLKLEDTLSSIEKKGLIEPEHSLALVQALLIIDDAYRGLHPGEVGDAHDSIEFARLRAKLREGRPLFESEKFRAYPKPRRLAEIPTARGQANLCDILKHLAIVRVNPQLDLHYQVSFSSTYPSKGKLERIGIIPAIANSEELAWGIVGDTQYKIGEQPGKAAYIHQRIRAALDGLLDLRTDLILLPELVSGDGLLTFIKDYIQKRALDGLYCPAFIVAGTQMHNHNGHWRNRAYIIDAEGQCAWFQDKLHAYKFSKEEQEWANYPLGRDNVVDRREAISVDPRILMIVDISYSERIAILICEDLIQDEPHRLSIVDFGVTLILSPIMDVDKQVATVLDEDKVERIVPDGGWVHEGAMRYVRHPAASVVVANSGALLSKHQDRDWAYANLYWMPRTRSSWQVIEYKDEKFPAALFMDLSRS